MSSPEHKELIWNLIKNIKVGMLVTSQSEPAANLHARPMSLVQEAYDGTLYFYTHENDEKVYEIEKDKDVCLSFASPQDNTYVSLSGTARLNKDEDLINRYWSNAVEAWFEGGKDNPNITMLEVKISSGEHWDSTSNKLIQIFEKVKSTAVNSKTPNLGDNDKFGGS